MTLNLEHRQDRNKPRGPGNGETHKLALGFECRVKVLLLHESCWLMGSLDKETGG